MLRNTTALLGYSGALLVALGAYACTSSSPSETNGTTTTGAGGDGGAGGGMVAACHETTLDASLCDPASATFSLSSTNLYYPLTVGLRTVLEGDEDGALIRIEREVLTDTEMVAGVEAHVLEHREYEDGEIIEIARNFYVEASDGTVCYFGEDVENYVDGVLDNSDGSWRADDPGAKPGIIMPAMPAVSQIYFQENAPDNEAWDMGRVESTDTTETFASTSYDNVVTVQDSNPFDDCEEEPKKYVASIGEVQDDVMMLIEVSGN